MTRLDASALSEIADALHHAGYPDLAARILTVDPAPAVRGSGATRPSVRDIPGPEGSVGWTEADVERAKAAWPRSGGLSYDEGVRVVLASVAPRLLDQQKATHLAMFAVVNLCEAVQDIGAALGTHGDLLADDAVTEHVHDQATGVVRERNAALNHLQAVREFAHGLGASTASRDQILDACTRMPFAPEGP